MGNKIILEADTKFEDRKLRQQLTECISKLDSKMESINKRTKGHTWELRDLKKRIKELEKIVLK